MTGWLATVLMLLAAMLPAAQAEDVPDDTFTVVAVPDTQIYVQSEAGTEIFRSQFEWIVANQQVRNIVFATHEGDVSQEPASVTEWDRIESVFALLDDAEIPYGISPGNHDIDGQGNAPQYDARFGVDRYAHDSWFGGNHEDEGNRSSYQTVSVEGHDLLFLHVRHLVPAYGSVEAVLEWADGVLAAHPDHLTFVTTHEFTDVDGSVLMPLLQAVIEGHCSVAVVFSGHRTAGAARGTFEDGCGRTVHHVLTNYQHIENGGQGFLRTVEINRLTYLASFEVYSPHLDENRDGPAEAFTASLSPLVLVAGDASCSRDLSVADSVMMVQFIVGLREARQTCPLVDGVSELNVAAADANNSGTITVADAVLVAQCTVGLSNVLCPD